MRYHARLLIAVLAFPAASLFPVSGAAAANPPTTAPAASAAGAVVTMTDDDVFKPETVTISAGQTVRWENRGKKDEHTVTDDPKVADDAKDVSMPTGASPFHSDKIKPGASFEQRFDIAGTYNYVCGPHEEMGMKGRVVVAERPAK
jgi:plastocyanin